LVKPSQQLQSTSTGNQDIVSCTVAKVAWYYVAPEDW